MDGVVARTSTSEKWNPRKSLLAFAPPCSAGTLIIRKNCHRKFILHPPSRTFIPPLPWVVNLKCLVSTKTRKVAPATFTQHVAWPLPLGTLLLSQGGGCCRWLAEVCQCCVPVGGKQCFMQNWHCPASPVVHRVVRLPSWEVCSCMWSLFGVQKQIQTAQGSKTTWSHAMWGSWPGHWAHALRLCC